MMETIKIVSYTNDDINDFCEIIHDYSLRLSAIEDDYDRICNKLQECLQFIDEITVAYSFEYTKVLFKHAFESYLNCLQFVFQGMQDFPQIVETNCLIALNINTYTQKKKCIDFLDLLLSYYNASLSRIDYDIDKCINAGLQALNKSKITLWHCK